MDLSVEETSLHPLYPSSKIKRQFEFPSSPPNRLCCNLETDYNKVVISSKKTALCHLFIRSFLWPENGIPTLIPSLRIPASLSLHCRALLNRLVNCLQRLRRPWASINCAVKIAVTDIYKALFLLFLHLILTKTWGGNTILSFLLCRLVNSVSEFPKNKQPSNGGFCF